MTITLYVTVWGGFWDEYGQAWTERIKALDPKPDRVLIVSDRPIETIWDVVLTDVPEKGIMSHFRNVAVNNSDTDFVVGADLDDIQYTNFIGELDLQYDVIAPTLITSTGRTDICSKETWDNLMNLEIYSTPFSGSSIVKTETIKKVGGYPSLEYEDAGLYIKLRQIDAKVFFDYTTRYEYVIREDSLSHGDVDWKFKQLTEYFEEQKAIYNSSRLG